MATPTSAGQIDGQEVHRITLTGAQGLRAEILTYGARLAALWVPDRTGALADIVLGYDALSDWRDRGGYLGATCGRYSNRVAGGRLVLDGRTVQLDQNEGAQHLHGGRAGLDSKCWQIEDFSDQHAILTTRSPDGEMGYPGTLTARVTYRIEGVGLRITMEAQTDAPTPVNLVNHAYFNLAGHGSGDVLRQELQVEANFYLPVDDRLIPTGEVLTVGDTAFDFRSLRPIGARLPGPAGFDHNLCLSAPTGADGLRPCLRARDPVSGRQMRLSTTEPGLQLYTGAHFDGSPGKGGARYPRFAGFAAETQRFPNSPNMPHFPSARLDPCETYRHVMLFDLTPDC
ncbi:aldose epimerase family protein [Rhodobacter calidifons]|uniref:Aldose 1-epimerase n=1 Tax=Rhodobacter calidifons TaxID=2715277 RepID=A0ABX0G3I5_9RHOB|nr:aldose epimerase family protein [Rhodobacter calidifons]NHB75636.1 galactose mutarotase [Rhodobacter calidifons]